MLFTISSLPALTIRGTATNTVIVSWPSAATGFILQHNRDGVNSVNWSNIAGTIQNEGTRKTLLVNSTDPSRFYRLIERQSGTRAPNTSPFLQACDCAVPR